MNFQCLSGFVCAVLTAATLLSNPSFAAVKNARCSVLLAGDNTPAETESKKNPKRIEDRKPEHKSLEAHWKDVGIPFTVAENYFKNERCYSNLEAFRMCVAAIRTLVHFWNEETSLVTKTRQGLENIYGPSKLSFGPLEVVEMRPVKVKDPIEYVELHKKLEKLVEASWDDAFATKDIVQEHIDFERIVSWARAEVIAKNPDEESMITGNTFNAAYATIDPYARISPVGQEMDSRGSEGDDLVGIGIELNFQDGLKQVHQVIENSPAEEAGLMAQDLLTHVDGKAVSELAPQTIVDLLRGKEGTKVTIGIDRRGTLFDAVVTRRKISVENVTSRLYRRDNQTIGYIRLHSFMPDAACLEVAQAVRRLEAQGAESLVLDLRGNGGGQLTQAVLIAQIFLGGNQLVVLSTSLQQGGPNQAFVTKDTPELKQALGGTKLPLSVLIDAGSASASELLAGALQDHQRALIVGVRSFGKGIVQTGSTELKPKEFAPYDVMFYHTTARFLMPSGRTNQLTGIVPDFEVYRHPEPTRMDKFAQREEDVHLHPIPAAGPKYEPTNPRLLNYIQACVEETNLAKKIYSERRHDAIPLDYQLLYAADVMRCYQRLVGEIRARRSQRGVASTAQSTGANVASMAW